MKLITKRIMTNLMKIIVALSIMAPFVVFGLLVAGSINRTTGFEVALEGEGETDNIPRVIFSKGFYSSSEESKASGIADSCVGNFEVRETSFSEAMFEIRGSDGVIILDGKVIGQSDKLADILSKISCAY